MDYKYIEQLLERYFQCETTLKEEEILRSFFSQEDVPVWLAKYQALFNYETQQEDALGDDFDERILNMIEQQEPVKARVLTMAQRLKPIFKAAAIVAIVLTLGNAAQAPWEWGYEDPRAAMEALKADSINMGEPVQAENLVDTVQVMSPTLQKY